MTDTPRALVTIRYVRDWYVDNSREVNAIPQAVWQSLTPEQQSVMRFPIENWPDRWSKRQIAQSKLRAIL